ncbi:S1/P1 nuclease [Schlesneria paludicola]|uniref:S1/P1 nuclease n=1 Tax=Schlesneria paludicola TaxID=360056 RepID=UPI000299D322|nr:S1/P1 nuclease [Schlesneria paludicola]
MRFIVAFIACIFAGQSCSAWSEGGHHLIAVLAFDELTSDVRSSVLDLLGHHPRFEQDFKIPEKVRDPDRWMIGRAAFWPDVARRTSFDRPKWHYDVFINATVGDFEDVPLSPRLPPDDATLATKELNIKQAIRLCRKVLKDKNQPPADRAIALCWICHLVGDANQPCHSGSLYSKRLFPTGDRGGNEIPTKQGRNLHALWDNLLGPKFDEGDVLRRAAEVRDSGEFLGAAEVAKSQRGKEPECWLMQAPTGYVYDKDVIRAIEQAEINGAKLEPIQLSKEYLSRAGTLAKELAARAAMALAAILREDFEDN